MEHFGTKGFEPLHRGTKIHCLNQLGDVPNNNLDHTKRERRGSNPRHLARQASALPLSYFPYK
jgi:hypothetical protein